MPIDPRTETPISSTQAAKLYPRNAQGKHPHSSTIVRHMKRGLRGVFLESIRCGGRLCTSREAVARFFQRLTEVRRSTQAHPTGGIPAESDPAGELLDRTVFHRSGTGKCRSAAESQQETRQESASRIGVGQTESTVVERVAIGE